MVTQSDKVEKLTRVFTTDGLFDLSIKNEKVASVIGQYWNAIKDYLNTGETLNIQLFEGYRFRVGTKYFILNTRLDEIEDLYDIGELSFDDIYEFVY